MEKIKTSIVLSDATRKQIKYLIDKGYGNQSEVISIAIYGMYLNETATDKTTTDNKETTNRGTVS